MIINDVNLENRALEPEELSMINLLKGSTNGEMFSDVGRYLSPDQFKCLLRWIHAAQNPVIVKRKKKNRLTGESIITEEDYMDLEWEIMNEGWGTLISTGFRKFFTLGARNTVKKSLEKGGIDAAKKIKPVLKPKVKVPKKGQKELVKEPTKGNLKGAVDDVVQVEKKIVKDVKKSLSETAPKLPPKIADDIANRTAKDFLYKSGLQKTTLTSLLKQGWKGYRAMTSTILQAILKPLKLVGLAAAATWGPDIADGLTAFTIANANKEARKRRKGTLKHIKDCDADAHNIRAILRKHGWIMSATNTGY